jgi:hypothetical protein
VAPPTLRPLSVGEILDAGIKILVRHWRVLTLSVVGVVAPVRILYVLLLASADPDRLRLSSDSTSDPEAAAIVGFLIALLLVGLTFLVVFTACFKTVSDAWLGATPSASRSLRFGLRRLGMVLLLSIVWGVGLGLASILLLIPGIWLAVTWCLSIPVMLFERVGPFAALQRSFALVRGRFWATLLIVAVGYVLTVIVGGFISLTLLGIARAAAGDNLVANGVAQVVGGTIAGAITYPFAAAVLTVLYFDQRVRKEGFDLQLLAEGLGTTLDPDAPLPPPLVGPDYLPEERASAPYWPPPPGWTPPSGAPAPAPVAAAATGWTPPAHPSTGARGWAPPRAAAAAGPEPAPARTPTPDTRWGEPFGRARATEERPETSAAESPRWGRPLGGPPTPAGDAPVGDAPAAESPRWGRPLGGPPTPAGDAPVGDAPAAESPRWGPPLAGPPPAPTVSAGGAPAEDPPAADAPPADVPEPKRDKRRAEWLPPEPPRGSGGL